MIAVPEDPPTPSERPRTVTGPLFADLDAARDLALAAGRDLLEGLGEAGAVDPKGGTEFVTEADRRAEKLIVRGLRDRFPGDNILTEEAGSLEADPAVSSGRTWYVDPLDGTTNYAHGYPFFGTSVGLCWRGQPLLGALAIPSFDELLWAAPRLGAWCNGRRIHVSGCERLADALLVTGFAYDRHIRLDNNYAEFAYFTHRTHGVRRGGAAAVDLAFVATGRLDGYWERGLSPWDLAAGVVLVEQAGGVVSAYDGGALKLDSGRVVAAGQRLHPQLVAGLQACSPLSGASFGAPELDGDDRQDPATPAP